MVGVIVIIGVGVGSEVGVRIGVSVGVGVVGTKVGVGQAPQSWGQFSQVSLPWQLPFPQLADCSGLVKVKNKPKKIIAKNKTEVYFRQNFNILWDI